MEGHEHDVAVYDTASTLIDRVTDYAASGLAAGDLVVTVSRAAHRQAVDDLLADRGVDTRSARRDGRFITLDADATMARFFVAGVPDPQLFRAVLSTEVPAGPAPVRVFGEMVAILWESGDVVAALQLESLWEEVLATQPIDLLCAFASQPLADGTLNDVATLCAMHDRVSVIGPHARASDWRSGQDVAVSGVHLPVLSAVASARHFVTDVVDRWGMAAVRGDVALVASELATNAVTHGRSPFIASVTRGDRSVRIAVEDSSAAWPERHDALEGDQDGRGMAIVELLSRRVGCESTPHGKVAWAELSA